MNSLCVYYISMVNGWAKMSPFYPDVMLCRSLRFSRIKPGHVWQNLYFVHKMLFFTLTIRWPQFIFHSYIMVHSTQHCSLNKRKIAKLSICVFHLK